MPPIIPTQGVTIDPQQSMPQSQITSEYVRMPGVATEQFANEAERVLRSYDYEQKRLAGYDATVQIQNFELDQKLKLAEAARNATDNGKDFAPNFMQGFDKDAEEVTKNIDPLVGDKVAPHLNAVRKQLTIMSYQTGQKVTDNYESNTTANGLDNLRKTIQDDPSDDNYSASLGKGEALINATGLPPAAKSSMLDEWHNKLAPNARLETQAKANPVKVLSDLGGDTLPKPDGSVSPVNPKQLTVFSMVRAEATKEGVNPDLAAASVMMESSGTMSPGQVHEDGRARGWFGLTGSAQTRVGYPANPSAQDEARTGVADMKIRIASFKKDFGRDPAPWEYYAYHWMGEGAGKDVINAANSDPNAPMTDVVGNARGNVPGASGKTVGEFVNYLKIRANNAMSASGGAVDKSLPITAPEYAGMSYDDRNKARAMAERQIISDSNMQDKANTHYAQIQQDAATKTLVDLQASNKLTPEIVQNNFRDVLSGENYNKWMGYAQRAMSDDPVKISDFKTYKSLRDMSVDPEQAHLVKEQASDAVGNGFLNRADYDKVTTTADKTISDNRNGGLDSSNETRALNAQFRLLADTAEPFGTRIPGARMSADTMKDNFLDWYLGAKEKGPVTYKDMKDKTAGMINDFNTQVAVTRVFNDGLQTLGVKNIEAATPKLMSDKAAGLDALYKAKRIDQATYLSKIKGLQEVSRRLTTKDTVNAN